MPASLGPHPRYLEELRIGGGFNSTPDGGVDFDKSGNIAANGTLDIDGAATFGDNVTIAGDLEVAGVDTTWSIYLPASLGMPDPSLPCAAFAIANWRNFQVATGSLAFDQTSPEAAYFQFRLPDSYDGRPLKFTIEWSASAGTSGDVRWGVLPISFADGYTLDETGTTTYVVDSFISTKSTHICTISATPTHPIGGSLNTVRIIRLSNHASDTFNADAILIGVGISY
ncbi:MAG: hypothetical protein JNK74_25750 [Candidatus Hydrogenedentes bacterium]|nr:hypothetical protein [Candidatus Hydrogenedentota bacterium]